MSQPPTGPRLQRVRRPWQKRGEGDSSYRTGPSHRGAFSQATPAGPPAGGYINPNPYHYPGHTWAAPQAHLVVNNENFPVLPGQPVPDEPAQFHQPPQSSVPTWASQFGLQGLQPPVQDKEIWLTPRHPSLPPTNTGSLSQPLDDDIVNKTPGPEELDNLFASEALQRNRFAGLTTFEAQLFCLHPTSTNDEELEGGMNRWFQDAFGADILDTWSMTWLSVLRPDRWATFGRKIDEKGRRLHDQMGAEDGVWGWENGRVGLALKPCIVLTDAILRVALQGRWMQSILHDLQPSKTPNTLKDGIVQDMCHLNRRDSAPLIERPAGLSLFNRTQQPSTAGFDQDEIDFGVHHIEDQTQKATKKAIEEQLKKEQERREREVRGEPEPEPEDEPVMPNSRKKAGGKEDEKDWATFVAKIDTSEWEQQAIDALDDISHNIIWTFYDAESDPNNARGAGGRGLFHVKQVNRPSSDQQHGPRQTLFIIALNTELFLPMLDDKSSPMEKVLAIHTAAIVMIRGLITAISMWKCARYDLSHLAYDRERIADLASSFENDTFGGALDFPFQHDRAPGGARNGRAMLITGSDWPNAGDWVRDHFPSSHDWMERLRMMGTSEPYQIRTQWHQYPIPGAYSLNLLKRGFWKKSHNEGFTLKFPKHFKALTTRCAQTWGSTHLESKTFPVQIPLFKPGSSLPISTIGSNFVKALRPVNLLEDECWNIGDALRARRKQWEVARRGWYPDALLAWELTPYSMPQSAWMLRLLKFWIDKPSLSNEYYAHELLFRFWLNEKPSSNGGPLGWFYVAVGHMFAACLPSRSETEWHAPTYDKNVNVRVLHGLRRAVHQRSFDPALVDNALGFGKLTPGFYRQIRHGGLDERKRHLRLARRMGEIYFFSRPHARTLKKMYLASLRNLEHQAREEVDATNWWHCQFELPPYSADLEGANEDHTYNTKATSDHFSIPVQGTGVMIKPQDLYQFAATMAQAHQSLEMGPWNRDTKADEAYMAIQSDDVVYRYWTIGEIADQVANRNFPKWYVVEPEADGRWAVVDVTKAGQAEGRTFGQVDSMLERGPYGYQAKSGTLKHHFGPDAWKLFEKVGYVIPEVRQETVNANDGIDGKPLWIQVGDNVFDITRFPWYEFGGSELATRLRKQFQSVTHSFLNEGGDLFDKYPAVLERLMPYRCAKIAPRQLTIGNPDLRMFLTREEVRWHEFPETGMYVIIDRFVYDVSEYVEVHPGGEQIIRQCGGQDITNAFYANHQNPREMLQLPLFKSMLVGRIIPTRSYDQPVLAHEEERSGYIWSTRLLDTYPDGTSYCLAKRLKEAGPMVRMRPKELQLCDGDDTEGWFNEGWVAVDDLVYNMTSVVRYSKEPWVDSLKSFLGEEVDDRDLARVILEKYRFRAVAMLEDEDTEDDYVLGKRKKGDAPRDYANQLQKRDRLLFNDSPADIYLDDADQPHSNIPDLASLSQKYPFKTPRRRRPPAPYNDYATPFDKHEFSQQATGRYYRLVRDQAKRRKGEEIDRRDREGKRVDLKDWGKFLIQLEDQAVGAEVWSMADMPQGPDDMDLDHWVDGEGRGFSFQGHIDPR